MSLGELEIFCEQKPKARVHWQVHVLLSKTVLEMWVENSSPGFLETRSVGVLSRWGGSIESCEIAGFTKGKTLDRI